MREYKPINVSLETLHNKCGVYQIVNRVNQKLYIGSSKNLYQRLRKHFKLLECNKHDNPKLQHAYNKYGLHNFYFQIIEYCCEQQQYAIEQYWINKFFGQNCYNINNDAIKPPNLRGQKRIFSEQHKHNLSKAKKKFYKDNPQSLAQLSQSRKGKNMGGKHFHARPVICLETKQVFDCIMDVERTLNIHHTCISDVCNRKRGCAGNYHWLYLQDYEQMCPSEVYISKNSCKNNKVVVCLETQKIYTKLIDASKDTNCDRTAIRKCCENKQTQVKGLHWIYYEEYIKLTSEDIQERINVLPKNKVQCRCVETQQIFTSIKQASIELKIPCGYFYRYKNNIIDNIKGLHFEFI